MMTLLLAQGTISPIVQGIAAIAAVVILLLLGLGFWASRYFKAGPNEVLVISGGDKVALVRGVWC